MIAKVEGEKNMVVVGRFGGNMYSMCTLKKDLKVKEVRLVAKSAKETDFTSLVRPKDESMQIDDKKWWRKLMVNNPCSGTKKQVSLDILVDSSEIERFAASLHG